MDTSNETTNVVKNFALIGAGGYIAPRHLKAIKDTGNNLIAALDPKDSVGILDKYFFNTDFFTEFERFERHIEKLRREDKGKEVDYVSICSPNYLHDSHIRFALRMGSNAICEKPIVLNPWNIDALMDLERELGKGKVYTILQLRTHPSIVALKERIEKEYNVQKHAIDLTYITPRGNWYFTSWKGDISKSGGIATNIGVHFFDMLIWIFGKVQSYEVHYANEKKMVGYLELEKASVRWFLSIDKEDLFDKNRENNTAFRSIKIDGEEFDFSEGFTELHTEVYKRTLAGNGFTLEDTKPSIELVNALRNITPVNPGNKVHPLLESKKIDEFSKKVIYP